MPRHELVSRDGPKAMRIVGLFRIFLARILNFVILAKAGIHSAVAVVGAVWIPAFAGMTVSEPMFIAFQNRSTQRQ